MRSKLLRLIQPVTLLFTLLPLMVFIWYAALPKDTQSYSIFLPLVCLAGVNFAAWLLYSLFGSHLHPGFHCAILILLSAGAGYIGYTQQLLWVAYIAVGILCAVSSILTSMRLFKDLMDTSVSTIAFTGLVLYGINYMVGYLMFNGYDMAFAGSMMEDIAPFAVIWLLAVIWITVLFHTDALNSSRGRKTPRRVFYFNCILAGVFTLIVLAVYSIDVLKQGAEYFMQGIAFLLSLIGRLFSVFDQDTPSGSGDGDVDMGDIGAVLGAQAHQQNLFDVIFMYLMEAVVIAALVAAAAFLLFKLYQLIRYLLNKTNRFLNSWEANNQSYIDEREDLMNAQMFREEMRSGLQRIRRRLTRRPNLKDLPDDRARVRALYQWMLEKSLRRGKMDPSLAPTEYLQDKGTDGAAFALAYEKARYSEHEPEANSVAVGERLYHKQ